MINQYCCGFWQKEVERNLLEFCNYFVVFCFWQSAGKRAETISCFGKNYFFQMVNEVFFYCVNVEWTMFLFVAIPHPIDIASLITLTSFNFFFD